MIHFVSGSGSYFSGSFRIRTRPFNQSQVKKNISYMLYITAARGFSALLRELINIYDELDLFLCKNFINCINRLPCQTGTGGAVCKGATPLVE
jgi:hypothetical protein